MTQRIITFKKSQLELLQFFRNNEEKGISPLDKALWRAARFGRVDDLKQLLSLGANINAQDSEMKITALHISIKFNKTKNAKYLISRFAKYNIADNDGKTAYDYTVVYGNHELRSLLTDSSHQIFKDKNILSILVGHLPYDELILLRCVSTRWLNVIDTYIRNKIYDTGLTNQQFEFINNFDTILRHVIFRNIVTKKNILGIPGLVTQLENNSIQREKLANEKPGPIFGFSQKDPFAKLKLIRKDAELVGYKFNIINEHTFNSKSHEFIHNKYVIYALEYGLITIEQINDFRNQPFNCSTSSNFMDFFTIPGLIALKNKLISVNDAMTTPHLRKLLKSNGLIALRENLITISQVSQIKGIRCFLDLVLTDNGLIALRKGYITLEQAAYIECNTEDFFNANHLSLLEEGLISYSSYPGKLIANIATFTKNIQLMISEIGVKILRSRIFTQNQLCNFNEFKLSMIMTEECMLAIKTGVYARDDIEEIWDVKNACSPFGVTAIKEGLLTIQQAKKMKSLQFLQIPGFMVALKEGLITCDDLEKFVLFNQPIEPKLLVPLFSESGLIALREKFITIPLAAAFYNMYNVHKYPDNPLEEILNPLGIIALRKKIIYLPTASTVQFGGLFLENDPIVITALERNMISLEDFQYKGKSYMPRIKIKEQIERIKLLVNISMSQDCQKIYKACLTIQSYFRCHLKEKKLKLQAALENYVRFEETACLFNCIDYIEIQELLRLNRLKEAEKRMNHLLSPKHHSNPNQFTN